MDFDLLERMITRFLQTASKFAGDKPLFHLTSIRHFFTVSVMANRYKDWYRQAEGDLKHAKNACKASEFDWSCFAAHQAGEKALKAVLMKNGTEAWGHTLTTLLDGLELETAFKEELAERTRILDKHYIPTRYPNGLDSGSPTDFYTKTEAETAIDHAEYIIEFCKIQIH